ncbi:preprotein translocase subunit SecG [Pantoea sp. Mhis]|uniref:preprotein translocase subunit SecG n=1 Tax=Pantoea sp. Mhis TaxID=2576759 RepID=UPI00135CD644|nr:preprotein translocase subunit SecG [Pantoea sp. Mhis]MXP56445.1 preprotein translocase subunit SecG [Pantoea sp. Mhis]
MYSVLLVIFLIVAISLVSLIILQKNKTDISVSSGAGSSSILFNSVGSASFITRMTSILAVFFFIISLILANLHSNKSIKANNVKDKNNVIYSAPKSYPSKIDITNNDIPK